MAKATGSGCLGWLVAGVLVVVLVTQCVGSPPSADRSSKPTATVQNWRYVRPAAANCRAQGFVKSAAVERLERNDYVGVLRTEGSWSLIERPTNCWVRRDLLNERPSSESAPVRTFSSSGSTSNNGRSRRAASGKFYANCSAARAAGAAPVYRGEPGYARRLDRDGDGVGCE